MVASKKISAHGAVAQSDATAPGAKIIFLFFFPKESFLFFFFLENCLFLENFVLSAGFYRVNG
jgi:hypothetical protein